MEKNLLWTRWSDGGADATWFCNALRWNEKWEGTTPSRTCHATTNSSVATADDEYVHDDYDGSKNLSDNGKKRHNDHDDVEDDD